MTTIPVFLNFLMLPSLLRIALSYYLLKMGKSLGEYFDDEEGRDFICLNITCMLGVGFWMARKKYMLAFHVVLVVGKFVSILCEIYLVVAGTL